jgi:ATP-dependent exoDNAse (exonuclease V) alpha subunit
LILHPALIAKTNTQVAALNRAVRQRLRAAGELTAEDAASLAAVTPSGQQVTLDLAEGDRLRFLTRNDALGIVNGTEGRLERIERAADGGLRLKARIGERLVAFAPDELADEMGRAQLAHAYATTCYGSQGLTTEVAFVLADPAMDRHDIHVAASRARGVTQLFVDRRALDARVQSERLLGERDREVGHSERSAALAAALARSGVKQTTLDYLTPSQRQALVERSHELDPTQHERSLDQERERSADRQAAPAPDRTSQPIAGEGPASEPADRTPSRRRDRSKGLSLD